MSISDTVKKVMPYLKTASGYVLHRLSSQAVEMDDGTTLEQKVTSLNSLISNKVDTSNVVNNCLTTEAGFVLDARQGKVLDDKITELNGNIKTAQTFDRDEIDTGETWVDGKKIYRRTFVTTDVLAGDTAISIPISFGHDSIWIDQGNSFIKNDQWIYPIPLPRYSNSDDSYVGIWIEASKIVLFSGLGSGWNESWTKVVTVRYTKK